MRIIKNWDFPDLMRQTPGRRGVFDDIRFTMEPVQECDYCVVLNAPSEDVTVRCPPDHVWAIMQEPPNEHFGPLHRGDIRYRRVYTTDPSLRGRRYVGSQPALPWHVNRDYDELQSMPVPEKNKDLSWITSNIASFAGHRDRLQFLERIKESLEFDLFGRGFRFIDDKWDGLAPYRYALAVENWRNELYWSEKLADAFLAWTVPFYYGCTRIADYFPPESFVEIDIRDPHVTERIKEEIDSDRWAGRLAAVAEARRLILNRYQIFPFLVSRIRSHSRGVCRLGMHRPRVVFLPRQPRPPKRFSIRIQRLRSRLLSRTKGIIRALRRGQ